MSLPPDDLHSLRTPTIASLLRDQRGVMTVEYTVLAAAGLVVALALLALATAFYTSDQTSLDALTANVP